MEPYIYVSNNPIRYVDPNGMEPQDWIFHFRNGLFTGMTDTGKGSAIIFDINGKHQSLSPRGKSNQMYFSAVVSYITGKVNPKLNSRYEITPEGSTTGGYHTNNTNNITITDRSFLFNNYNDIISNTEHENDHFEQGPTRSFLDHADVYFRQAASKTFSKTSPEHKRSNAAGYAQRLLNSYVKNEIDLFSYEDKIDEYNKLNPNNKLIRNGASKPMDETISIERSKANEVIKYDKTLKFSD